MHYKYLTTFVLSLFSILSAYSFQIDENFNNISIIERSYYTIDCNSNGSVPHDTSFKVLEKPSQISNHFTDCNVWLRFELHNTSNIHKTFYLESGYVHLEVFSLFKSKNDTIKPLFETDYSHPLIDNSFYLEPGEKSTFYIQAKNSKLLFFLTPQLISSKNYIKAKKIEFIGFGIFYGAIIFIFIYNLILFFNIRFKYFLFYTLYILFFGLLIACQDGILEKVFYSHQRHLSPYFNYLLILLSYFFNFWFLRTFLRTKKHLPNVDKIILYNTWFLAALFFLSFIPQIRLTMIQLFVLPVWTSLISVSIVTFYSYRKKILNADLILYSYLWIIVFGGIYTLQYYELINTFINQDYIIKIGLIGELIILSYAASSAVHKNQLSLQDALNLELERSHQTNKALKKTQEELEKSSKIKDQFLVNISHELRTPMNAVLGFTSLLQHMQLSKNALENLKMLKTAANGLMQSIEDILSFKEYVNEEFILNEKAFDIHKMLEYPILHASHACENKGLEFKYSIDNGIRHTYIGDAKKIEKALTILLNNAIKFTNKGIIELSISIVSHKEDQDTLCFKVKDTGIGIDPSMKEVIFEAFRQENEGYARSHNGVGLGLALFDKIIKCLKGKKELESTKNIGSIFSFELSLKCPEETFRNNKIKSIDELNDPIHILLVEDDEINRVIADKIITSISNKIILSFAHDGKDAIEKIIKFDYQLIFMDLQMPTMNGYEATRIIRTELHSQKSKLPIIALTAHALESEQKKCFDIGMNDFITKPYNVKTIESCLLKHINEWA